MKLLDLLFGRRLANREASEGKIGSFAGLASMGLDGLSSSAYGPEAALAILIPLGAAGLGYIVPITALILALLAILYASYRQTIAAYPRNGGSYTVAKENIGTNAGLLAASALMLDYVLNVAVGISAGVAALVSAAPALQPYTVWLCLGVLLVITLFNLRGTKETGMAFAVPTYLFLACFLLIIGIGVVKTMIGGGSAAAVAAPPPLRPAGEAVGLWILLRAFASGCTAMTGVEAVSNGVNVFREPAVKYAQRTLTAIVVLLAMLLAGIAYLVHVYGIGAMDQSKPGYQSVLSQLTGAIVGRGAFYYVAIASLLIVLLLSANTSFVGFPRLCRLVAEDEFLPRAFASVGRRLVYSVGVTFLAAFAGLLIVVFDGITDRLIPLFAIGAFLAFTLSQAGMAVHGRRQGAGAPGFRWLRVAVNGFGAGATGVALLVILAAKFRDGAWITVLVIPCVLLLLKLINRQYTWENLRLRDRRPLRLAGRKSPVALIPMERWNRLTDKTVAIATELASDVIAVHLTALAGPDVEEREEALRRDWAREVEQPARAAGLNPPRLVLLNSPYRRFKEPLLRFIRSLQSEDRKRPIAVLIPELIKQHWWQYLLHTRRARALQLWLLRYGGPTLMVISVPWYLDEPRAAEPAPAAGDAEAREEAQADAAAVGQERASTDPPRAQTGRKTDGTP